MRKDMEKVIVERPRWGSSRNYRPRRKAENNAALFWDEDGCESNASSKGTIKPKGRGRDIKELNENLNPLYRFLESKVGKSWNETYSEIREHFGMNSATGFHIFQHVKSYVDTSPIMYGDVPGDTHGPYSTYYRQGQFYVLDDILYKVKRNKYNHSKTEKLLVSLGDDWYLVKLKGMWFKLRAKKDSISWSYNINSGYGNVFSNNYWSSFPEVPKTVYEIKNWPRDYTTIPSTKKQLSSKELKEYELENDSLEEIIEIVK
jgi:hypothetical protein